MKHQQIVSQLDALCFSKCGVHRFQWQSTQSTSTLFDPEVGECFKSRHDPYLESAEVFYRPGVLENPYYLKADFHLLELGMGLGTNLRLLQENGFQGNVVTLERDLSGAKAYLEKYPSPMMEALLELGHWRENGLEIELRVGNFDELYPLLPSSGFHCIFFDPFSPKANPLAWKTENFQTCFKLLVPGGRLVTYSVCRTAKDNAALAEFEIQKLKLPPGLNKRSSLLALKPL